MENKKYYSFKHLALIKRYQEEGRYEKALKEYELYLTNYPNDPIGQLQFANLLIKLNLLEQAEKVFNLIKENENFKVLDLENYYLILLKLLSAQKKYKEAYDLFIEKDMKNFKNYSTKVGDKIFLCNKLGLPVEKSEYKHSYHLRQLYHYNEERFLKHIKKHFYDSCEDTAKFYKDVPFQEIYPIVKELLPTEHFVMSSICERYTIFRYDNCGYCNEGPTNYFKVVFIANTNSITTMYPHMPEEYIGFTDLNYLKEEQDVPTLKQVKRLSQIEKFNQKYKMN